MQRSPLKRCLADWECSQTRAKARARKAEAVSSCPFCNEAGYLELKEHVTGRLLAHPCPHRAEQVNAIEERLRAYRA